MKNRKHTEASAAPAVGGPEKSEKHEKPVGESGGPGKSGLGRIPLFILVLAVRGLVGVFSPGYIHPDEFFQSVEVTAHDIFRFSHAHVPWEYRPEFPCRSIVPPAISTGIPLILLKWLDAVAKNFLGHSAGIINARTLLYFPRAWIFLLSLVIDIGLYKLLSAWKSKSSTKTETVNSIMTLFGSSWVVLLFFSRSFSNTMESFVLAIAILCAFTTSPFLSRARLVLLGGIFGLGLFTRFTFIFFIPPIGLYALYKNDMLVKLKPLGERLRLAVTVIVLVGGGFILVSIFCILCDSIYFGFLPQQGTLTITPYNNFIYNMNTKNLAEHGIHPRVTHLLVNFPGLLGPVVVLLAIRLFSCLRTVRLGTNTGKAVPSNGNGKEQKQNGKYTYWGNLERMCLGGCLVSGLIFLSLAPHQELRFLVPLVFPAALLVGEKLSGSSKWHKSFLISWILFNATLTIVYGAMHQGGVLPSLFSIQQRISSTTSLSSPIRTDIVYYRTYMPPRYLLAIPESEYSKFRIHDLGSRDLAAYVEENITKSYTNHPTNPTTSTTNNPYYLIHLVCPYTKQELVAKGGSFYENLQEEKEYWPHFGGEDLRLDFTLRWYTIGVP